ncbi:hypothetical protein A4R44_03758 [Amycolatopsis sp. M39]|nr:hypothetical protein A4R44_03758 [Amycolatopsis sp. M39]
MTDARCDAGETHPRAETEAFCPGHGNAIPRERPLRLPAKRARRLSPRTEREQFAPNALFTGKTAAHRGGLPAAGSGRATTTVRGEQAR